MHPDLLQIGPVALRSWGLMMAISVLVGVLVALKRAKKLGVNPNTVYDMVIVVVISAIVGSRFFYVIYHLEQFRGNWVATFSPFHGPGGFGISGLSMMGGVALVIVCVAIYAWVKKLNFGRVGDVIAPSFLLGAGITRIGCFLNGCCYGRPTCGALGMHFPEGAAGQYLRSYMAQHPEVPVTGLLPTQLFASAFGFLLFFVVLWLDRWRCFDGFTSWLVLIFYCIDRFIVDQFRYYEPEQIIAELGPVLITVNELVLLAIFVFSLIMFWNGYKKSRRSAD